MSKLSLKNILGKNNESTVIINSLIEKLQAKIRVEDESGKILLTTNPDTEVSQYPVRSNDEILGWVKGDEKKALSLLNCFICSYKKKPNEKN